jgi:O-antigen ligase
MMEQYLCQHPFVVGLLIGFATIGILVFVNLLCACLRELYKEVKASFWPDEIV